MADISKIVLGSTTYNIKDTVARAAAVGGMHFLGVSLSEIADDTTNVAIIKTNTNTANRYYTGTAPTSTTYTDSGTTYTLTNVKLIAGDVVIYRSLEFVFSDSDSKWHELGSTGTLGDLAYKSNVSVTYKKATGGTLVGTKATISVSGSTSGVGVSDHSYTPAGTISGTVKNGTPSTKRISSGVTTSQLKTISLRGVAGTTTAVNASYANETLTLSAVTAATANAAATTVATGAVDSKGTGATVATGSAGEIDAITDLGTPTFSGSFTGTTKTIAHTVTQGSVTASGSYTPEGSVTVTNSDASATVSLS